MVVLGVCTDRDGKNKLDRLHFYRHHEFSPCQVYSGEQIHKVIEYIMAEDLPADKATLFDSNNVNMDISLYNDQNQ